MSDAVDKIKLGSLITELPKSSLPASAAEVGGHYHFFCSSAEVRAINSWLQEKPAIIMGTGGVASVNYGCEKYAYSTDTWCFRSQREDVQTRFLFRKIQQLLPKIEYVGFEGSGLKHLRKGVVKSLLIDIPKKNVQNKIIEILDAVDDSISATESLIAKYQKIKAGLMHDLFTRGVTADGKLRPPREQAPELYHETAVGWIPVEWYCEKIKNLLAPVANNLRSGPFGSALLKYELVEEGIPFLGIDNIFPERFEGNFRRFIPMHKYLALNRYAVRPNDVVITIMGTVGRYCVLPKNTGLALSSKHLWTMTFDEKKVIPELVCWQLNYAPWVLAWFRKESQGAVMDAIQSSTLKTLHLPVPDIVEQKLILERYLTGHSKITSEQNKLEKIKKLKSGLMHDLLTGKVQVKIDEFDQEPA
ncbi:MAG: hypothetical protein RIR39_1112 [Pseudomonadota bacterium]|jgi:type I restriction enzyme S subunit